jgi:nitrite reductase/ring-hydroxylating ferredoxin subunit
MAEWVPVCSTADVPVNSVKAVEVGNDVLAVYNIEGAFYVTDDACTHGAASLADGFLDGDVIECSLHGGAFHVPTGDVVAQPCSIPLRTYKVLIRDDEVLIDPERRAADPA